MRIYDWSNSKAQKRDLKNRRETSSGNRRPVSASGWQEERKEVKSTKTRDIEINERHKVSRQGGGPHL